MLLNARHTQRHRRKPATVYVVLYLYTAIPQLTIQTRFYRPTDFLRSIKTGEFWTKWNCTGHIRYRGSIEYRDTWVRRYRYRRSNKTNIRYRTTLLCINDVIATRGFCRSVRAVAQNSPPIHSNWYYVILNSFKTFILLSACAVQA